MKMKIAYRVVGCFCVAGTILFSLAAYAVLMKARWAYVDWRGVSMFAWIAAMDALLAWLCFAKARGKQ